MSRTAADLGTRYSLWGSLPAIYANPEESAIRRLQAQVSTAAGAELRQIEAEIDRLQAGGGFLPAFVDAFDTVLSPAHASIEDLDLYLDAHTAPADFLAWLGTWLGLTLNERWPLARRREFVASATEVFALRGTLEGIRRAVELYLGQQPVVEDSGGVSVGGTPLGDIPGTPRPRVTVTVSSPPEKPVDLGLVYDIVDTVRPAHVLIQLRAT